MKLVEDDLRVPTIFSDSPLVSPAHIHARLSNGMAMTIVFLQCFHEPFPGGMVDSFGRKQHPLFHQISKDSHILLALADMHLIDAHTDDAAEIGLPIPRIHLPKEHAPQAGIELSNYLSGFADGHLTHEQQGKSFKLFGEMSAQSFPGRPHPENMTTPSAFTPRQLAGDFTPVLEDIEVTPTQLFSVIIAEDHSSIFGAPNHLPKPRRLLHLKKNSASLFIETALVNLPVQSQSQ